MYLPGLKALSANPEPTNRSLISSSSGCTASASALPAASQYTEFFRGTCFTSSPRLVNSDLKKPRSGSLLPTLDCTASVLVGGAGCWADRCIGETTVDRMMAIALVRLTRTRRDVFDMN